MTTFFISRHPGAKQWANEQQLEIDQWVYHLDTRQIQPGDTVIGTLPVNLAAEVQARGARYLHLSLNLPAEVRGQEFTADDMAAFGAKLQAFQVTAVNEPGNTC